MTGVITVALLWAPVLWFHLRREPDREMRRLLLGFALSTMAAYSIAEGDVSSITANPVVIERVIRGLLSGAALLLVTQSLGRRMDALARLRSPNLIALAFYVCVAVLSTAYSVYIPSTAGKAFQLGVGLVVVVALATRPDARLALKKATDFFLALVGALVVGAIIGFFVLPSLFVYPEGRPGFLIRETMGAPYAHPNGLSADSAMLAGFALARALKLTGRQRWWWLAASGAGALGTLLASGRQGLAILVLSVACVLLVLRPWLFAVGFVPAVTSALLLFGDAIFAATSRGQNQELIMTLSGRTVWWASAINTWLEQPLTGYGFGVGGRFVALERIGDGHVSSVHSGLLEVLLGVGIIGFIPLAYVLFRVVRWALAARRAETEYAVLVVTVGVTTALSLGIGGADLSTFFFLAALADRWFLEEPRRGLRWLPVPTRQST